MNGSASGASRVEDGADQHAGGRRTGDSGTDGLSLAHPAPGGRGYRAGIALAMALAAVSAWSGAGSLSIARDEGFSISTSLRPWPALADMLLTTETNGWLYALVLKVASLAGIDPGTLRAPSALAFVATVPVAAAVARRLFGDRVALLTAFGIAVNGGLLMYAQQVRSYALAVLLATLATLVFLAEVRRPRAGTLAGWVLLVAATAACQLQMLLVALPHLIALTALPAADRRWPRRLGGAAAAALLTLPTAVAVLGHEEGQNLLDLRPGVFRDVLVTFSGRSLVFGTLAFGAAGVALALGVRRSRRFGPVLVLAWAGAPFAALLLASLVQPTLIGRYLLFCLPAVVIALALLVDACLRGTALPRAGRTAQRVAAGLLAVGAAWGGVGWHLNSGTEDWDGATRYVLATAAPTDRLVVANDSVRLFFEYTRRRLTAPPPGPVPAYPPQPWGGYETGDQAYRSPTDAELAAIAAGAERIWVVVGRDHVDAEVMPQRVARLAPAFTLLERRTFAGGVDVDLYARS